MENTTTKFKQTGLGSLVSNIKSLDADGYSRNRVDLVLDLKDSFYSNDEQDFEDMLPLLRFLPSSEPQHAAYTSPDGRLFLAYKGLAAKEHFKIVTNEQWEFAYCHEALHHLYHTFDYKKELMKVYGKVNHTLLNHVSDCIINESLVMTGRARLPVGVFKEEISLFYQVEYSPRYDNTFTLYKKIIEKFPELDDPEGEDPEPGEDPSPEPGGDPSPSPRPSPSPSPRPSPKPGEDPKDKKPEEDPTGEKPTDKKTPPQDKRKPPIANDPETFDDPWDELDDYYNNPMTKEDVDRIWKNAMVQSKGAVGAINRDRISTKKAVEDVISGATVGTLNGFMSEINRVATQIVSRRFKEPEPTRNRPNRQNPFADDQGILKKGEMLPPDQELDLTIAYYVDISGSMSRIDNKLVNNIFTTLYRNNELLKKRAKQGLVNLGISYWAFNTSIAKVTPPDIPVPAGGNVSLSTLINMMKKRSKTAILNVMITDAGFVIDPEDVWSKMEDFEGNIMICVDEEWRDEFKKLQDLSNNRIRFVADVTAFEGD